MKPLFFSLLTLVLTLSGMTARAQIVQLDNPNVGSGLGTDATAVQGNTVVGYYYDSTNLEHPYTYDSTTHVYTTLAQDPSAGTGAYIGTQAYGYDGSTIVGQYVMDNHYSGAFTYAGGVYVNLSVPLSANTIAYGISGNNVVGTYSSTNYYNGFLYNTSTNTYVTVNNSLGASGFGTVLEGIDGNNAVGYYYVDANDTHSFIYNISAQTFSPLAGPAGSTFSVATGISGNIIVGYYYTSAQVSTGTALGFTYDMSTGLYTTIAAPPGGLQIFPLGTDGTSIVGILRPGDASIHGFEGTLTPVPEPSTWVLLVGSASFLTFVLRRKSIVSV